MSRTLKNKNERKSFKRSPHSGRKKSLGSSEIDYMINRIEKNPRLTSQDLKKNFDDKKNISVSARTVRRDLFKNGYKGCIECSKPLLSEKIKNYVLNLPKNGYI